LRLFQERRGGGIKENDRGGEFNYVRTFVDVTMYPKYNNKNKIKIKNLINYQKKKKTQKI
jgi:hypothetical protein